jgi:hypothetical protein
LTNPASWTKLDVAGRITSRDSFFATQPSPWYALNAYYDDGWKYANDGVAAGITINNFAQGRTSIGVAPSGTAGSNISWVGAIHIDNSNGNVGVGATSPGAKLDVAGASLLANNTSIDPDAFTNRVVAGAIADGSGWALTSAIGGNAGTGHSWAIGSNGSNLYFGYQNGTANDSMQTFMQVFPNRNVALVPTSGNVGIGTTGPNRKLEVVDLSNNPALRAVRETTATSYTGAVGEFILRTTGDMADGFGPGIIFDIQDNTAGPNYISGIYSTRDGADDAGKLHLSTRNGAVFSPRLTIDKLGNVGIGTTAPSSLLDVRGRINTPEIAFRNADGGDDSDPYRLRKYQFGSNSNELQLHLNDDADERFAIYGYSCNGYGCGEYSGNLYHFFRADGTAYHAGNVGIGTTAPAEKLHIAGNVRGSVNGALRINTGNGYVDVGPQNTGWSHFNTDRSRFYFNTGITVDTGNIGSYDEDLNLQTAGTTRMTILNSNGNVGIGTTNPQEKLEITGNLKFSNGDSYIVCGDPFTHKLGIQNTRLWFPNGATLGTWTWSGGIHIGTGFDSVSIGWTGSAPAIVVSSVTRNVGIGTTAPGSGLWTTARPNLDVTGSVAFNREHSWDSDTYARWGAFRKVRLTGSSPYIEIQVEDGNAYGINIWLSTEKAKTNISDLEIDSNKIYDLKPVSFNWKTQPEGAPKTFGLIAEDTAKVIPELVAFDEEGNPHFVNYDLLSVLLLDQLKKMRKGLVVDSTGNVGIGTNNPTNILTIQQNSATDPIADAWLQYSSRRWKTNIVPIKDALEKVEALEGVYFDWKADGKHDIGMVAEDVGKVVPEVVVYEENGIDARGMDYSRLVPLLVEAIKEQQHEIDKLKKLLRNLGYIDDKK